MRLKDLFRFHTMDPRALSDFLDAAGKGDLAKVKELVEGGADVNAKGDSGYTALMKAATNSHIDLVRYLAKDCGADVNAKDYLGYTALMKAAESGHLDVVRFLAEDRGADVDVKNEDGATALMLAVVNGHIDIARFLVEDRGADVNATDSEGNSALRYAANRGDYEMLQLLTQFAKLPQTQVAPKSAPTNILLIDPSELALMELVKNSNVGGEYLAKWLDADVAVKLFVPDAAHTSFQDEARLWQQLRHPNVIKMYGACDVSHVGGLRFFVCEYASGGSLLELVRRNHKEKDRLMWKRLHEAALGLEYLHERKIIHGDLRCSNILIGSDGLSKLSNFGLSGSMSATSSNVGAMRWQAPEVLEGEMASFASGVYSLGMCVLEAATGKAPWSDEDEVVARQYKTSWEPELNLYRKSYEEPKCPAGDARDLVWRMCCQNPAKRLSLSSVVCELERLATNQSSLPEAEPASATFDNFQYGQSQQTWAAVVKHMENKRANDQYHRAFADLQQLHESLSRSPQPVSLLVQFHFLLTEFQEAISLTEDQVLAMRLSSTRVTSTSVFTFHRRMESLWQSLGETVGTTHERQAQWEAQQRDAFMAGVSDLYLRLNDLQSDEERQAFITTLKAEAESHDSKYTSDQLGMIKKTIEALESKLEGEGSIPKWFIPWYELIVKEVDRLGAGGFGSVYRAKWLDSEVVVKRLGVDGCVADSLLWSTMSSTTSNAAAVGGPNPKDSTTRASDLAKFRHEVDIWFTFRHPHVIQLFGACHVGRPFFVCEYATNGTLISFLINHPDQLWEKLLDAALGVQYLHARKVVHGDLKGNNIVVGSDMKAKVTDFGLSSITSDDYRTEVSAASHWVAPECFQDDARPTPESDIYSLGMCIIESLRVVEAVSAGKDIHLCLPWGNIDNSVVRVLAKSGQLPRRPQICTDDQWGLVKRICAFEPAKRIKISTVVEELAKLAYGQDVATVPVSLESVPEVVASSRKVLANLPDNRSERPFYNELCDRVERIAANIGDTDFDDKHMSDCRVAFCSLVGDVNEVTTKLLSTGQSLISVAAKTMRCYELNRRLDKFLDAYGWTEEVASCREASRTRTD